MFSNLRRKTNKAKRIASLRKAVKPTAFLLVYTLVCRLATGTTCFMESCVGIPCPGCGLTRAWVAVFHLQFRQAFFWHPLFWLIPAMALVWLGQWLWSKEENPRWFSIFLRVCFAVFMAVYAVRMVLYFPHTAPMLTNPDSFTWRIGRGIRWLWEWGRTLINRI